MTAASSVAGYDYGVRASGEAHGVVQTKPHIAQLLLELSGYTTARDLTRLRLLEPSCGQGTFLAQAVPRLLQVAQRLGCEPAQLGPCITACDIEPEHVHHCQQRLATLLRNAGLPVAVTRQLVTTWVQQGDFLLTELPSHFDVIVGNPPYVRLEQLTATLRAMYKKRYPSLQHRADLYIAFFERALSLVSPAGVLSFICADRWTVNQYGAPLRRLIAQRFRLQCYLQLLAASPFESQVAAYPSIVVLTPGQTTAVPVVTLQSASPEECAQVLPSLHSHSQPSGAGLKLEQYEPWFVDAEPWVLSSPQQRSVLRQLESCFPPLTDSAQLGIGIATGNDSVYIVEADCAIEPDRLVPLVMREDLQPSSRRPPRFVINTFDAAGQPIDLRHYPLLQHYLSTHRPQLEQRYIAKKQPRAWFRTIDRLHPGLRATPKLLIPDIAGACEVSLDQGRYYPHHNLYFVTSKQWDLEVLGGLLSSRVALFFVWSYAAKLRGGYLRFQAQYLRRIRLPAPHSLDVGLAAQLKQAFVARDFSRLDVLAQQAYGLVELPAFDFVDTRGRAASRISDDPPTA